MREFSYRTELKTTFKEVIGIFRCSQVHIGPLGLYEILEAGEFIFTSLTKY